MKTISQQKGTEMPKSELDGLLKAGQLASKMQTSVRLVRRMVADGEIPFVRLGKSVRFYYPDVLAALKKATEAEQGSAAKKEAV
jgi:excisionase family DNA binding protein